MKTTFLILALIFTSFISAQSLSSNFITALKTDDAKTFIKLLNDDNINACYETGNSVYTFLALSIKLDSENCFKVLLDKKADLEKACSSKTPLMYTTKYGDLEKAKALIKAGVNPKAENSKGRTALDYAKKYKQKELAEYLESI